MTWITTTSNLAKVIGTAELRRIAGLIINASEVYTDCRSYLKGSANSTKVFHWGRDVDSWHLLNAMELVKTLETSDTGTSTPQTDHPLETGITSR